MMSVNGLAPYLISRTAPSKPDSRLKRFWNRNVDPELGTNVGLYRTLSLTFAGASVAAEFGSENANWFVMNHPFVPGGDGGSTSAAQPGGTPASKFSLRWLVGRHVSLVHLLPSSQAWFRLRTATRVEAVVEARPEVTITVYVPAAAAVTFTSEGF